MILQPAFFEHDLYDVEIDRKIENIVQSYPARTGFSPIVAVGHSLLTFVRGTTVQVFQEASCTLYEQARAGQIANFDLGDTDATDRAHFDPVLGAFFDKNLQINAFPEEIQEEFLQYSNHSFHLIHLHGFSVLLPNHPWSAGAIPRSSRPPENTSRRHRLKSCALLLRKGRTNHERITLARKIESAWPTISMLFEGYGLHTELSLPSQLADFDPELLHSDLRS